MKKILGYVIIAKRKNEDKIEYMDIDQNSGGYPYWSGTIKSSTLFKNKEEAKHYLRSDDFVKSSQMNNGEIYPPRMIQVGTGVNCACLKNEVNISIKPIILGEEIFSKTYIAEIKKPTGFKYD
jgi:hypothetical protein